jgi:O-antigen/teichoic acid export membrane protein
VTRAPSLNSLVLRGVGWKLTSQTVLQVLRLVIGLTLARLLTPDDYGLAAMALAASALVLVFSDLALGAALVQRKTLDEEQRSTVFWTGLAAGVFFTLLGLALAGPVAAFYGDPRAKGLFAALSLSFVLTSLGTTQRALLTREMNFRKLELRIMLGSLFGGIVGVAAAAAGAGAWAIILQQLVIAVTSTMLLWVVSPWRPRFTFSFATLKELGGFSGYVFGTRLVYALHENSLSVLIGRYLGAASLGAFSIAYTIVLLPLSRVAIPVGEVLFPAFSRMQDDTKRMAEFWIRAVQVLTALCAPALIGLVVVAPDFVDVVLGERWHDATPVIQILAWVGLVQSIQSWNGGILMGLGRARTLFFCTASFLVVYLSAFAFGLQWGIVGVAASYAVASTLLEAPYLWVTTRVVGISPWAFLRPLGGIALATALMGGALVVARLGLIEQGIGAAGRLALLIPFGALVYAATLFWTAPGLLGQVRSLRARRAPEAYAAVASSSPR